MKKHLFLIAGNIGMGKTTACSKYPVTKDNRPSPYLLPIPAFRNLYALGKTNLGADSLDVPKQVVFDELQLHTDKHILVHGVMYNMVVDCARFMRTHTVHLIVFKASQATNIVRLRGRNPNFNESTIPRLKTNQKRFESLEAEAISLGVDVLHLDCEQSANKVQQALWLKILKTLNR